MLRFARSAVDDDPLDWDRPLTWKRAVGVGVLSQTKVAPGQTRTEKLEREFSRILRARGFRLNTLRGHSALELAS